MTSDADRATQLEVARKIALDQLNVRQRSVEELRGAMNKRNVPDDVAEEIITRFREVGLLDDAAFAATLTASRSGFGLRGSRRIRQELQQKGVDREVADEALAGLSREYERQAAVRLAERRARSLTGLEPHVARRRLMGVLARRGFPAGIVTSVTDEVLGGLEEPVD